MSGEEDGAGAHQLMVNVWAPVQGIGILSPDPGSRLLPHQGHCEL